MLEGCSEFLPDEVALIMNCSRAEATTLAEVALILVHRLPDTWAALADGELNWPRARAIAAEIVRYGPELDPHVLAAVEAVVLPQAAELAVGRLRALMRAELVKRDAEAAERRRRQAEAAADVRLRRSAHDGMAEVVTVLPQPVAAAMFSTVDAHARQAKADGDPRPIGRIRAEVMADLTLRPWDDTRPAVTAELRVLAPINALLPDPADPTAGGEPTGIAAVEDEPITAAPPPCPAHRARRDLSGRPAGPDRGLAAPGSARRRRRSARHPHPPRARAGRAARLPRPPGRRLPLRGRGRDLRRQTTTGRPRPAALGHAPATGTAATPAAATGSGWTDLDHVIAHADGGRDRLRQPVLPVPPAPPAEDPRARLDLPPRRGRRPAGHHTHRRHPDQPTTGRAWLEPYELGTLPPGVQVFDPAPF